MNKKLIKESFEQWFNTVKEEEYNAVSIDSLEGRVFSIQLAKQETKTENKEPEYYEQ